MRKILPLFALLATVSGCAVPDLGERPQPRAASSLPSGSSLAGTPQGAWPVEGWWRGFGDPQLDALIEEGLASSPDIAVAAARTRAAEALARQANSALLPRIGAEGSAGAVQQSKNLGIPPQFVPDGIQDTGHVAATFGFDLDLWGKNRAALAAATSDAEAARVDQAQARLVLTTAIAAAYADLAGYYSARDAAEHTAELRAESAGLTAKRVSAGLDNQGSARAAASRVPASQAEVTALDQAIALTRNRIAALVGSGPDRGLAIARPRMRLAEYALPAQAGIDLVGRRPDIVAARLRVESAAQRIEVAHADFYPNISLSALVGLQSLGLGNLISAGSEYGNATAAISLPIFDGGRIAGRYRGARAAYDEAVARYDQTLITALREVADALAARKALDKQLLQLRSALADADEASRLAGLRYTAGLTTKLAQLTAEDNAAALRRSIAQVESQRMVQEFALIRALGGGYQAPLQGDR
ncbi:MAG: efflux transporter outer membrane subunit [Novosphingobium sp.]